jgi:hypothetical protein
LGRMWGTRGRRQKPQTRMKPSGAYRDRTGDLRLAKHAEIPVVGCRELPNRHVDVDSATLPTSRVAENRREPFPTRFHHRLWSPWMKPELELSRARAGGSRTRWGSGEGSLHPLSSMLATSRRRSSQGREAAAGPKPVPLRAGSAVPFARASASPRAARRSRAPRRASARRRPRVVRLRATRRARAT